MVAGGVTGLGLPETLGKSLPQTLRDAEELEVDCSLQTCCPKKRKSTKKIYQGRPEAHDKEQEFSNNEEDGISKRNSEQEKALLQEHREREGRISQLQQRQSTSSV